MIYIINDRYETQLTAFAQNFTQVDEYNHCQSVTTPLDNECPKTADIKIPPSSLQHAIPDLR